MSVKNGMRPVHPGEILREELEELGLSANAMAQALDVPANRVSSILKGQRGITADTALRLSRFFGTTPQVWMNLQKTYELRVAENESGKVIAKKVKPWSKAANA
jgi:addiction module HigA family antidote